MASSFTPDADQQEAIDTLAGPLIIVAGAGTGKTATIMRRIDNLVAHGVRPKRILAITFTKKAAVEMRSRLSDRSRGVQASTIHAWCLRLLHDHYREAGSLTDLSVMSDDDQIKWYREIIAAWVERPEDLVSALGMPEYEGRLDFAGFFAARRAAYGYGEKEGWSNGVIEASRRANDPGYDARRRRQRKSADTRMVTDLCRRCREFSGLMYNANRNAAQIRGRLEEVLDGAETVEGGMLGPTAHLEALYTAAASKYEEIMRRNHVMDFDFLLRLTYEMLTGDRAVLAGVQASYDHVFVDEYQDTSQVQADIVDLVAERTGNICVVGDPDQSIYSWRGAAKSTMDRFARAHPGYKEVHISTNYRSQQAILDAANEVIAENPQNVIRRHPLRTASGGATVRPRVLSFADDKAEGKAVASLVRRRHDEGVPYADIALLMRTHALGASLERWLRMASVPYYVVGALSFFDRKVTKDLVAYMTCLFNPFDDMALTRAMGAPPKGLGAGFIDDLRAEQASHEVRLSLYEVMQGMRPSFTGARRRSVEAFLGVFEHAFDHGFGVADILSSMLSDPSDQKTVQRCGTHGVAYRAWARDSAKTGDEAEQNGALIDDMYALARQYDEDNPEPPTDPTTARHGLADFVAGLQTAEPAPTDGLADAVPLMTVHAAKGLEFDTVVLVGAEEGIFPFASRSGEDADKAREKLEEERRLMYVAMTRAKRALYITHAGHRRTYGSARDCVPSRFVTRHRDAFDFPYGNDGDGGAQGRPPAGAAMRGAHRP